MIGTTENGSMLGAGVYNGRFSRCNVQDPKLDDIPVGGFAIKYPNSELWQIVEPASHTTRQG